MPQPSRVAPQPGRAHASKFDVRWLMAGEALCREGEAPGPLYILCSGQVRVYRRVPNTPDEVVELARLGPGAVIGELAPILNQPRSATVEAVEPTQVLEVPLSHLATVARRQTPLVRVIAHALRDRTGLTVDQLKDFAGRLGLELPEDALTHVESSGKSIKLPAPEHDKSVVYPKEMTCPACGTTFSSLIFRPHKDQAAERASDFHQVYKTSWNPYDYEIWVCPTDLYAALPAEFSALTTNQKAAVDEIVAQIIKTEWGGQRPDFNVDRTLDLREKSLQLALALYRMRGASPLRLAAVLHRLAWCAREKGNATLDNEYLGQALACYQRGYEDTDLGGPKEELRVQYLCGELNLRLGEIAEAMRWFGQALRHPALKQFPKWEQMLRDQWSLARAAAGEDAPSEAAA